ncbi:hypothetical protein E2562_012157 [Oryza meyeriana var. granulata]|uniref:Uncharacterized protein n=1 Tax=Oryza meyeriana var. granulata TaxID=110450 RepID=A0A6G1F7G3_9ORYZ|nr:hypothetical protein E2562_012157 [Oryza meyeriana var. granulata]
MSASPEFYRPSAPAFSPSCASSPLAAAAGAEDDDYSCRTPTPGLTKEPATCPPAPRKPRPVACRKLLFDHAQVISLRLDDLERLFRPMTTPPTEGQEAQAHLTCQ